MLLLHGRIPDGAVLYRYIRVVSDDDNPERDRPECRFVGGGVDGRVATVVDHMA